MNVPVDVLAAAQAIAQMRGAADDYAGDNWPEMAKALTKWADALDPHRAAVTELIEAAKELRDLMEDVRTGEYKPDSFTVQSIDAALARVQGVQS